MGIFDKIPGALGGSKATTDKLAKKLLIQKFKYFGFNISDFPNDFLDELTQKIVNEAELTAKTFSTSAEQWILINIDVYATEIAMELDGMGEGNLSEDDPFGILIILKKHGLVQ
jgi:hypothetical protein